MRYLASAIVTLLVLSACGEQKVGRTSADQTPALADTLVSVFQALDRAVREDRIEAYLNLLDTAEAARLKSLAKNSSLENLWTYLKHRFSSWPDPDTLTYVDLVQYNDYVRLTLAGHGLQFGYREERVSYTFMLFRKQAGSWRLTAFSQFEKERFDPYGTELSYFETELPPKLRFPRMF